MAPKKNTVVADGADTQTASSGADTATTSSTGDDTVSTGSGSDSVATGAGNDAISPGAAGSFNGADPARFDHDGDGQPGGSLPKAADVPIFTMDQAKSMITEAVGAALAARDAEAARLAAEDAADDDETETDEVDLSTLEPGTLVTRGAPPPRPTLGPGSDMCTVRITKTGQGHVHTGATGTGSKKTYDWRDEVVLPREVGLALEGRSYCQILD